MRVGILTGGGDCPGLNAVIRAVVTKGERQYGDEVVGFRNGWAGVMEGDVMPLSAERCRDILPLGGTILGTSRANPYAIEGGAQAVRATLEREAVEALVAVGGDDTLGVAGQLAREGVPVVGVPKTIDNDLGVTELTFGFHTAVQTATEAIDRLRTTAESHHRVMVVEVMGRDTGWIATYAGIAGGAAEILIPEEPFDIAAVCKRLRAHHGRDVSASVVVAAEGARPRDGEIVVQSDQRDAFGHVRLGGVGRVVADEIEARTGFETRLTVLGHVQRGGTPTAFDRVLATRFGIAAIDAVHDGHSGKAAVLQANQIRLAPLEDLTGKAKLVDRDLYETVAGALVSFSD